MWAYIMYIKAQTIITLHKYQLKYALSRWVPTCNVCGSKFGIHTKGNISQKITFFDLRLLLDYWIFFSNMADATEINFGFKIRDLMTFFLCFTKLKFGSKIYNQSFLLAFLCCVSQVINQLKGNSVRHYPIFSQNVEQKN